MQSFADNFENPIQVGSNGDGFTIPLLTTRDYLPWLAELTQQIREREKANIPANTKPIDRFRILRNIEIQEAVPDDLVPIVFTADGTIRLLKLALKKAGKTDDDAEKFIDSRPAKANEMLAVRVSGLFTERKINEMYMTPEERAAFVEASGSQKTTFGNQGANQGGSENPTAAAPQASG